ncbi:MAG: hypothetical protein J5634_01725 [Bacilli bacterium]|nr:hypothetical protein [Bacilli bacterium]
MNGKDNEFSFVVAINRKKVGELNLLLYDLIHYLFPYANDDMEIKAWKNHYNQKTDVLIKIGNVIKRISIKMGSRNSVHEESLKTFINFLIYLKIPKNIIDKYLYFHFGDGTINGKGIKRVDSMYLREHYKKEIEEINKWFSNKSLGRKVCDRFIVKGLVYHDSIDALVYGTPEDFLWLKKDDIYKIMDSKMSLFSTSPHFGFLTLQPYSRCIDHNKKYEFARYKVQLKWYSLFDDIIEYMNKSVIPS